MISSAAFQELPRITNEQFNEYALFQHAEAQINNKMSLDLIIRLFALTSTLSLSVSYQFPSPLIDTIKGLIERKLSNYWGRPAPQRFSPSESLNRLQGLHNEIVEDLEALAQSPQAWKLDISKEDESRFIAAHEKFALACEKFVPNVHKSFERIKDILENLKGSAHLDKEQSQQLIAACLEPIEAHHKRGKEWARVFFEFSSLAHAKLSVNYYQQKFDQSAEHRQSTLQTSVDQHTESRYLRYSIVPEYFHPRDYIMLPFMFFHEYTAHLVSSMYPQTDKITKRDCIYHQLPDELTHGWMFFASQLFFEEDVSRIKEEDIYHINVDQWVDTSVAIDTWLWPMLNSERHQEFNKKTEKGFKAAEKFLKIVESELCNGDKKRAKKLYYRLSFDIITRYPIKDFSHLALFDELESWVNDDKRSAFKQIIQECLQEEGSVEFIHLDRLWTRIRRPERKVNLPISRASKGD